MKIGNLEIKGKLVLAPMAGYTNSVYRNLCGEMGASLVYSEMISDKGLLYANEKTILMTSGKSDKFPLAVQLFGGEIEEMVKAAKYIDEYCECDIIDINMGCPVRKVLKAKSGSYLLQDIDYAAKMVESIVNAVKKPVTVKIRLGYDHDSINCVEMAKALEKAGASAIAIHGRCKSDMYSGKVNLDYIKQVKESVSIPVIGNGDIKSYEDALHFLEYTNVDALMIGRASFGNPWIFKEISYKLDGKVYEKPSLEERVNVLKRHIEELVEIKGEHVAVLEMRTIAIWYLKGLKKLKPFKDEVVLVKTKEQLLNCIDKLIKSQEEVE